MASSVDAPESSRTRSRVREWWRHNVVFAIATALAAASCLAVPPDDRYADYLELRTLVSLFCMLAVVCALQEMHFFSSIASRLVAVCGTRRSAVLTLVWITLLGSMLITNDMALIAFLPLSYYVLSSTGNGRHLGMVFVLQTAAANLGGMITPFGSPQNLYLYSYYELSFGSFVQILALPFAVSASLITALCLTVGNGPLHVADEHTDIPPGRTAIYLLLFAVAVAVVVRALPLWTGAAVPLVLAVMCRPALAKVDYGLMGTFLMFFVFAGNLARLEGLNEALTAVLNDDVLLWSAAASQVISNVPTAILFSQFTDAAAELLVGVNVGGVGTPVASLASLIALAEFQKHRRQDVRSYLVLFTAVNVGLLVLLLVVTRAAFALDVIPSGQA